MITFKFAGWTWKYFYSAVVIPLFTLHFRLVFMLLRRQGQGSASLLFSCLPPSPFLSFLLSPPPPPLRSDVCVIQEHHVWEGERRTSQERVWGGGFLLVTQAAVGWSWIWKDLKYWAWSRVCDAFVQP